MQDSHAVDDDDLATVFEEKKRKWEDVQKHEREILEAEKQAWEVEKARMATMVANLADVVTLNVGGRLFTTSRATLCQVEGSLLANMFSGRWENSLVWDEKKHVFLDLDPDCFELIMKWLRMLRIDPYTKFPVVPDKLMDEMEKWRNYLGFFADPIPIPDLNWKITDTRHFRLFSKTIERIGDLAGPYDVRLGPVWNHLADIPSKIEFLCAWWTGGRDGSLDDDDYSYEGRNVKFYDGFKFGFRHAMDNKTRAILRSIGSTRPTRSTLFNTCLRTIKQWDRITISVQRESKTYSIELNHKFIQGPCSLQEPCELVLRLPRVGQSFTLL